MGLFSCLFSCWSSSLVSLFFSFHVFMLSCSGLSCLYNYKPEVYRRQLNLSIESLQRNLSGSVFMSIFMFVFSCLFSWGF